MNTTFMLNLLHKDSHKGLLLIAEQLGGCLASEEGLKKLAKGITGCVPTDERGKGMRDVLLELLAAADAARLAARVRWQQDLECPKCHEIGGMNVFYSYPCTYECQVCGARLKDANDPGIPVLTETEAKQKRPGMYGLPACEECSHAAHGDDRCPVCDAMDAPRVIRLVEVQ